MPEIPRESQTVDDTQSNTIACRLSQEFEPRLAIRFFVEEDKDGLPRLPIVDLKPRNETIEPLREALETMVEEITKKPVDFKQTGFIEEAQLIITARRLPHDRLTITDFPGGQIRMTFNNAKLFDRTFFKATAVHALEPALGYPMRKYLGIPNDPYIRK